jgi:asparagine synthase (glutamine-hydrolysing)
MCGICGYVPVDPREAADRGTIARMAAALVHRGPDGSGLHVGPGVGLGVRRLAIVDLATGDQPIASEDGSVVLVCNGEIYNAPELRAELERSGHRFRSRSDVEVAIHLYEELGFDFVERLRGMFGLALWDGAARRLVLARDRFGIKPVVYAATAAGLWFASEAKAILAGADLDRAEDPRAIEDLLTFGFVRTPRTMFRAIRRLPAAHILLWQDGEATLRRYWRPPERGDRPRRSETEWAEALLAKLEETVRVHLRSDVEVGAWLSPGLDSSGVVSLARRVLGRSPRAVSLAFADEAADELRRFPTLDAYPGHELPIERATCDAASFARLPEAVWHLEEPTAFALEIPRFLLARTSARRVKVVITGEGADEVFGGYPYFRWNELGARFARLPQRLRRMLLGAWLESRHPWVVPLLLAAPEMGPERYRRLVGVVASGAATSVLGGDLRRRLAEDGAEEPWPLSPEQLRGLTPFAALQQCEMQIRLPDYVLHTADRAAMAHGVEVRVPYLDHELVELCAGIPQSLMLRWRNEKLVLRRALAALLPAQIRRRRKRGLQAPTAAWWRGPLPESVRELMSAARLRDGGYFDPGAVAGHLLRHREGRADSHDVLTAVLGVQAWDALLRRGGAAPRPA